VIKRLYPIVSGLLLLQVMAEDYFPPSIDSAWEQVSAENVGADPLILEQALTIAEQGNSRGVVILKGGRIVAERYWEGWNRQTTGPSYSVAKSFAAVLIGAAIEDEFITGIDQASADFLVEWSGDPEKEMITIGDHLAMATGLETRSVLLLGNAISERFFATRAESDFTPATRWYYDSSAFRLCYYILEEATGMQTDNYAQQRIFDRIGMSNTELQVREEMFQGATIRNYQYLNYSALDAARFGLLVRHDGLWGDDQVVNAEWMQRMRESANDFSPSYGYLWWLNNSDTFQAPDDVVRTGPLIPDAPADLVAALGFNDQKIYIIPSLDIIVVRLGEAANQSEFALTSFDNQFLGTVCRAFGYEPRKQNIIPEIVLTDDSYDISWDTWNGRTYELETSFNLVEPWLPIMKENSLIGDGLPIIYSGDSVSKQFFRVLATSSQN